MKKKIAATVIVVILAVACVIGVLYTKGKISFGKSEEESSSEAYLESLQKDSDSYKTAASYTGLSSLPYLETEIDDVYYTISDSGEVKFYRLESGQFTEIQPTGTYDITVQLSKHDVSASVVYLKQDNKIVGYGLHTDEPSSYYPYALFHLVNFGDNSTMKSSKSCMLVVDTTPDDKYSNKKIYEEPFIYTYGNSDATRELSEANRTVGIDGTLRADYSMLDSVVISGNTDRQIFFSGRGYAEGDGRVDLMSEGGSGNNTDNIKLASDVLGYYANYDSDGRLRYLTVDGNGLVALKAYNFSSKSADTIKTFSNSKRENVIVYGDWALFSTTGEVYNLVNDKDYKINIDTSLTVTDFVTDGKTAALMCSTENSSVVILYDLSSGQVKNSFTNAALGNVVDPHFTADGRFMITCVDGSNFNFYIY